MHYSTLVPLQPAGGKTPVFFVPGMQGNPLMLLPLVQQLNINRPFYGLRSLGLNECIPPYTDISQIAAYHIVSLQAVQPTGPYIIGGYSFGGRVAFEITRQLLVQGHAVKKLIILDIPLIDSKPNTMSAWPDARFRYEFANSYGSGSDFNWQYTEFSVLRPKQQIRCIAQHMKKCGVSLGLSEIVTLAGVYQANLTSYANYVAPKVTLTIPVNLIRVDEVGVFPFLPDTEFSTQYPLWGWEQFSTYPIEYDQMSGNHYTMINVPHVISLAKCITHCLHNVN